MLDYSWFSQHLLVTAGDDGTVNLWDTTGRSPKVCYVTFLLDWVTNAYIGNLLWLISCMLQKDIMSKLKLC